jgi:prevent-host-death family protein
MEAVLKLRVGFDELLPARTFSRDLPAAIDRLNSGEVEHLVITKHNAPQAVLLSVERYEELLEAAEGIQQR